LKRSPQEEEQDNNKNNEMSSNMRSVPDPIIESNQHSIIG